MESMSIEEKFQTLKKLAIECDDAVTFRQQVKIGKTSKMGRQLLHNAFSYSNLTAYIIDNEVHGDKQEQFMNKHINFCVDGFTTDLTEDYYLKSYDINVCSSKGTFRKAGYIHCGLFLAG